MPRVSQILTDEIVLLAENGLKNLGKFGSLAFKLHAIVAAKKHGIKKVCELHDISRTSLTAWINCLKDGSLTALYAKPKKPRSPVTAAHHEIIKGWLKKENNLTINALRIRIEEEIGVKVGNTAVHRLMKKLGFSYITPRPKHYKQDQNLHPEFKKKSRRND